MKFKSSLNRILAQSRSWLRAAIHREQLESDMDAELQNHLESLTDDLVRDGHSPTEAARRARVALGPALTHKEGMRASVGLRWWDELRADLRYATRMLRKSLGFTAIAASSLALAIGANTTIFSAAKQILYERLAVPHAADLRLLSWTGTQDHVAVHHIHGDYNVLPGGLAASTAFSYPAYQQFRGQNKVLGDLLAFRETGMNATIRNQAQRVLAEMVSGNYYEVLGVVPQLGRAIEPADDAGAGQPVAVISDGLWGRELGRSPEVIGQWIKLNDKPVMIVGVNPRGFTSAKSVLESADVIVPLALQPVLTPASDGKPWLTNPAQWWVYIMGRARTGVGESTAQAALDTQLNSIVRATMPVRAGEDIPRLILRDGSRGLFEQQELFAKPMSVLMTLVAFVLLLACANIANLMLARSAQRQREMSVRLALGSGRTRILRQMLVESLMLAAIGGAGGLVLGYLGRMAVPQLTENAWARAKLPVHFDWSVFAFTAAITILTGILFGMAPALTAARAEVTRGLKEIGTTATRQRKGASGKALVGFQIALSTLLVIGAGLFMRTSANLNKVNAGFRIDHLLIAELQLPQTRYPAGKDIALHQQLERALAAVPGVASVAPAMEFYLSDDLSDTDFLPQGEAFDPNKKQSETYNAVGVDFFKTLGIPILAGRPFGPQDTATSPKVGIINESLAKKRFPNQNPVGKSFTIGGHDSDGHGGKLTDDLIQIVGICGDTLYTNLRDIPPPQFFIPYVQQTEVGGMAYELRTQVNPETIIPALRHAVSAADPDLPLTNMRTQEQQIEMDMLQQRLFVTLTCGFGLLALSLAAVGVYGVMAYSVAQRTNEIGIRLALGAQPAQVRRMILGESVWLAAAGIFAGVAGAAMLTRLVQSMLYSVSPYDVMTFSAGGVLILSVALAASWIPARRAAGVEPMRALRHE
jgi:predicted permease